MVQIYNSKKKLLQNNQTRYKRTVLLSGLREPSVTTEKVKLHKKYLQIQRNIRLFLIIVYHICSKTTPNDEFIELICHIYNVNKDWLVNGTGEMFLDNKTAELNNLAKKHNLSDKETLILENYLDMTEDKRKIFADLIFELAGKTDNKDDEMPQILAAKSGETE